MCCINLNAVLENLLVNERKQSWTALTNSGQEPSPVLLCLRLWPVRPRPIFEWANDDGNTWAAMMEFWGLISWEEEAGPKSIASEAYERQSLSYKRLKRSINPQRME